MQQTNKPTTRYRCPHLGLVDDPGTCYRTASIQNHCHCVRVPQPVSMQHQRDVCLTKAYAACPVLQSDAHSLPVDLIPELRPAGIKRFPKSVFLFFLAFISVAGVLVWFIFSARQSLDSSQPGVEPIQQTRTEQSTPLTTVEVTASPTITTLPELPAENLVVPAQIYSGVGLGVPFGREPQYVVHRVAVNESLTLIANTYHTSRQAIQQLNAIPDGIGVWQDDLLVIPYHDFSEMDRDPLRAVFVDSFSTIQDFSSKIGVAADDIRRINDISEAYEILQPCQWLLAPRDADIEFHREMTPTPAFGGSRQSSLYGPNDEYLLHQVTYENDLNVVSEQYDTTPEVLAVLNGLNSEMVLVPGQVLVIRPGFRLSSVSDRIYLFYILAPQSRDELMETMVWDADIFDNYNHLARNNDALLRGQWVIYPDL